MGEMVGAGVLAFGAGVAVGVLASRDWGWHRWNTDWHHHHVTYQNNVYVSNTNTFASAGAYGGGGRGGNSNRPAGNNRQGGFNASASGRPQRGAGAGYRPGAPAGESSGQCESPRGKPRSEARWVLQPPRAVRRPAPDQATEPARRRRRIVRPMRIPGGEPRPRPDGCSRRGPSAGGRRRPAYKPNAPANRPANANPQVASRGPRQMGAPAEASSGGRRQTSLQTQRVGSASCAK